MSLKSNRESSRGDAHCGARAARTRAVRAHAARGANGTEIRNAAGVSAHFASLR
jgi:hypothetical protein